MSGDALPPQYTRWITQVLGEPPAPEHTATCGDCLLCADDTPPDERFHPRSKCCTYVPRLPNFLVGRILRDPDPAMARGREILLDRIRRGVGVHPLGLGIDDHEHTTYEIIVEAGEFGRAPDLICPWFIADGGLCAIWRHRNAVCSTWYCRHDEGARGRRFWQAVEHLLRSLGILLQAAVARHTRFGLPRDPNAADLAVQRGDWGDWITDIPGYYRACADRADTYDWDRLQALDPATLTPLADAVCTTAAARAAPATADGPLSWGGTLRRVGGAARASGYLRFAALTLPPPVVDLVTHWRAGTLPDLVAQLTAHLGAEAEPLAQRLVDDELVKPRDERSPVAPDDAPKGAARPHPPGAP